MPANLLNYALYQAGWLAAVLGAARGHPWAGAGVALVLLVAHLALARQRRAELTLVLAAGFAGLIADSTQVALGSIAFPTGMLVPWLCPPWIVVMWMQFATTFRYSLRWLMVRPGRAAVAGALGGPLAYRIGERLGAIELSDPRLATLGLMGAIWLIAVPALAWLARTAEAGAYGPRTPPDGGALERASSFDGGRTLGIGPSSAPRAKRSGRYLE